MQLKRYKLIQEKENQLTEAMKNFILNSINTNGGRITHAIPEDEEWLSDEDKYTIILTFCGKHGGHYNVGITDIYTKTDVINNIYIYVDGIDTANGDVLIGTDNALSINSDDYSNIIHFIMTPFLSQIREFAKRLALKELVDKYEKLPSQLHTESGNIIDEYHSENWECLVKHTTELEELYIKCSEPNPNKHNLNSEIMAIICELAELSLIEENNLLEEEMSIQDETESRYIETYQDQFNDFYDEIEGQFWKLMKFEGIN